MTKLCVCVCLLEDYSQTESPRQPIFGMDIHMISGYNILYEIDPWGDWRSSNYKIYHF